MKNLINILYEGVYDKYNNKAIILAGGPGSGKSYVQGKILNGFGLKEIDSDRQFMYILRKTRMIDPSSTIDLSTMGDYSQERDKGVALTDKFEMMYKAGRLGLIVQGTGSDYNKIAKQYAHLQSIGYDVMILMINTSLETALERNNMRDRKVPEDIVKSKWQSVQQNLGKFQNLAGTSNFIIFDNESPGQDQFGKVYRKIRTFLESPLQNPIGKKWVDRQLKAKQHNTGDI